MANPLPPVRRFIGDYRFLSNFSPCQIIFEGRLYPSVENAYQAAKCRDPVDRLPFLELSPPEAKRRGRTIKVRPGWENMRLHIMEGLVGQKFLHHPDLAKKIISTGKRELIEGNWWGDTYWGVDIKTNRGENRLGKILMHVREKCSRHFG